VKKFASSSRVVAQYLQRQQQRLPPGPAAPKGLIAFQASGRNHARAANADIKVDSARRRGSFARDFRPLQSRAAAETFAQAFGR
jgi:hypothetical protein